MCLLLLFFYGLQVAQQLEFVCLCLYIFVYVKKKKGNNTSHTCIKLSLIELEQLDPAAKDTVQSRKNLKRLKF